MDQLRARRVSWYVLAASGDHVQHVHPQNAQPFCSSKSVLRQDSRLQCNLIRHNRHIGERRVYQPVTERDGTDPHTHKIGHVRVVHIGISLELEVRARKIEAPTKGTVIYRICGKDRTLT